jgi:hypothetical protein
MLSLHCLVLKLTTVPIRKPPVWRAAARLLRRWWRAGGPACNGRRSLKRKGGQQPGERSRTCCLLPPSQLITHNFTSHTRSQHVAPIRHLPRSALLREQTELFKRRAARQLAEEEAARTTATALLGKLQAAAGKETAAQRAVDDAARCSAKAAERTRAAAAKAGLVAKGFWVMRHVPCHWHTVGAPCPSLCVCHSRKTRRPTV